jgi:hypothetical protein
LERETGRILESIKGLCGQDLDITVDEFADRQSEIRDFIKLGIERKRQNVVEQLK